MMQWLMIIFLLMSSFSATIFALTPEKHGAAWVYSTKGHFADVKDNVVDAIIGQGLVISHVAHAQAMLDRTAKAVGVKVSVFSNAESLLFCKAGESHRLVQENPHNIILCPWRIAVYALTKKPGVVYVSYRDPNVKAVAYQSIHKLLETIVHEALGNND